MSHFVVYHKKEKMGYPAIDVDDLGIYTKKPKEFVEGSINEKVWLIAGEGKPRRYFLRACFDINAYADSDRPDFEYKVTGKNGQLLSPMPEIGAEKWFDELIKSQGNFAFGFNRINRENVVKGLKDVLAGHLAK
ncbi:hypothetical protein [uncultured Vibrio sp.]|uniref:hypothetical protein n=1 Tax=uncultured Vibrio sp. TaxID=114054 RepID=UPI002AAAF1F3|nr:hypothetical protein [uncultured Vibrio sp.]